jgi:hypothetical protein
MDLTASLSHPTREEWQRLADAQPREYAFMNAAWYAAWHAHMLPSGSWRGPPGCVVIRDRQGDIAGAFPYAWQKVGPLKFLSLGGSYGPLRTIPLAVRETAQASAALAKFFSTRREATGLRLGPVESTDLAVTAFLDELRRAGWRLHQLRETPEFVLNVPSSLDGFRQLVGSGPIKQAAYKKRRMERKGQVEVHLHNGLDRAGWDRVMSDVEAIEMRSWVAREGGLIRFSGPQNRAFWSAFLADRAGSEATRIWLLSFNGQAVSHCVTVDSSPVRYIITNAYLPEMENFSTGVIVLYDVLEDAINRGMQVVNYGEGDSGYKARWGFAAERTTHDWLAFPPGVKGTALSGALGALTAVAALRSRTMSRASVVRPTADEDDKQRP